MYAAYPKIGESIALSVPSPSVSGVAVPIRGHRMSGVPIHPNGQRLGGLGFSPFTALAAIAAPITGAIFGGKAQKRNIAATKEMTFAQIAAQRHIAELEADIARRQVSAALTTARIQGTHEISAINSAFVTALSAMNTQKAVADATLSAQITAQTQAGIFSLAQTGLVQSSQIAQAFPKAGTSAAAWIIGFTVLGLALSTRRRGKGARGETSFKVGPVKYSRSIKPIGGGGFKGGGFKGGGFKRKPARFGGPKKFGGRAPAFGGPVLGEGGGA